MAKSAKKARKPSTNQALEQLLGRKAAKRLRKLAMQVAADKGKKDKGKKHKGTKKNSRSRRSQ